MKRPSIEALETAAAWLESNEGVGSESDSCNEVSKWLDSLIEGAKFKKMAKEIGVSVPQLKAAVARAAKVQS